jgi:hypothetical protein
MDNQYFTEFCNLVERAEQLFAEGKHSAAAAYCQIAAHYASQNHGGVFVSPRLERLVVDIASQALEPGYKSGQEVYDSSKRVLHVLTQAFEVGGHTRMVSRWIANDRERTHSVVLTRQGELRVPEMLEDAVSTVGGILYRLDNRMGGLLSRARGLRELAGKVDRVVLHTHPYDVVPAIALADHSLPPVILVNHADHLFWLGSMVADVIAHIRTSGMALSVARRGIQKARCKVLPIPLTGPSRSRSREVAKQALGLRDSDVVLLSVASHYKYLAVNGMAFTDVILPLLERNKNVVLLVVGPESGDKWAATSAKVGGRFRVCGRQQNPSPFFEAADVYLDTFPFASLTSLLEAGSYGLPIVSYCPHAAQAEVFCSDDIAIDGELFQATDLQSYYARLSSLIEHPEHRLELGQAIQEAILRVHAGKGWLDALESVYASAREHFGDHASELACDEPIQESIDGWLIALQEQCALNSGAAGIARSHAGLLPFRLRLRLWSEMFKSQPTSLRMLVPEWARVCIRTSRLCRLPRLHERPALRSA